MTCYLVRFCGAVLVAGSLIADVNAQSAAVNSHLDAARAAVAPSVANPDRPYESFDALFDRVCTEPSLPDQMRMNDRSAIVPREEWFTWPVEIFDNLVFIGTRTAGVWAVSSSEGIIIVDASFHYSSEELVLGLLNFGLDPNDIRYIIVTHAHDDRYWGARALQDAYPDARVAMSGADWDVVAQDNSPAEFKPRQDMIVTDGQAIALGDVTVTLYITPGHTPGTLSMIIEPPHQPEERGVGRRAARRKHLGWDRSEHWAQWCAVLPGWSDDDEHAHRVTGALYRSWNGGRRRCDPVPHVESRQHGRENAVLENGESRSLVRRRRGQQARRRASSLCRHGGGLALQPDSSELLRSSVGVENGLVGG